MEYQAGYEMKVGTNAFLEFFWIEIENMNQGGKQLLMYRDRGIDKKWRGLMLVEHVTELSYGGNTNIYVFRKFVKHRL